MFYPGSGVVQGLSQGFAVSSGVVNRRLSEKRVASIPCGETSMPYIPKVSSPT